MTMRESGLVAIGLLIAGAGLLSAADDARDEILKRSKAYDAAIKAGDAKALDKLLDDDGQFITGRSRFPGKREYIADFVGRHYESTATETNSVRVFGTTAIEVGTWFSSGKEEGKPFKTRGRASTVWIRESGRWVVTIDHLTTIKDAK